MRLLRANCRRTDAAKRVFSVSHRLHVLWVNALTIPAQVIQNEAVRDWTLGVLVDGAVGYLPDLILTE
jgi:hypothetical protein